MSLKIIVLSCLLALAQTKHLYLDESDALLDARIVGGSNAEKGEFPHQVSLQWGSLPGTPFTHLCGGSILNEKWILTAGHCVNAVPSYGNFVVKAGKQLIKGSEITEQISFVAESYIHNKYEGNVAPYDIALLRLKKPLKFNKYVTPIKLPEAEILPVGTSILSGWGSISTDNFAIMPNHLQKVSLPIIDLKSCKQFLKKFAGPVPLHETNICTGPLDGSLSACSGDSGGPLVRKNIEGSYELIGVVSWGITPCGSSGAPSVYVRVSAFIDWIRTFIEDENL